MNNKTLFLIIPILLVLSFLAGKYSTKPEIEIRTVEVEKKDEKKNVVIETEEVLAACDPVNKTQPIKKTKTTDLSTIITETAKSSERTEKNKPKWLIGAGYGLDNKASTTYSGEINRRILDLPAFVGLQVIGSSTSQVGLFKLTIEF